MFRVGFGAMQLPGPGVFGPPRDRDAAIAVLRRAADLGVDHIDTAYFYGPEVANELIRTALHPYPDDLALVSKVGAQRDASGGVLRYDRPAQLRQGIEDNLRSLAVDHLAVVNLRLMDDARPDQRFEDQLAAMVKARDDGLIGGVGLSNVSLDHLRYALAITDIACVQNLMNLSDRRSMPILEECHARRIAFVPFFPLGSGFARGNPVLVSTQVADTAARLGCTPAQVALAWLLDLRPEVLLIPGTSSMFHLEETCLPRTSNWTQKRVNCWPEGSHREHQWMTCSTPPAGRVPAAALGVSQCNQRRRRVNHHDPVMTPHLPSPDRSRRSSLLDGRRGADSRAEAGVLRDDGVGVTG